MFQCDPVASAENAARSWRRLPVVAGDGSEGDAATYKALLSEFIRNPDPTDEPPADADDEDEAIMVDSRLCDLYGDQFGWAGV